MIKGQAQVRIEIIVTVTAAYEVGETYATGRETRDLFTPYTVRDQHSFRQSDHPALNIDCTPDCQGVELRLQMFQQDWRQTGRLANEIIQMKVELL